VFSFHIKKIAQAAVAFKFYAFGQSTNRSLGNYSEAAIGPNISGAVKRRTEISGLADEEPAGGNSPDGGFRDFVDFISSVDDEAAPPLAAQAGRHVPQRP